MWSRLGLLNRSLSFRLFILLLVCVFGLFSVDAVLRSRMQTRVAEELVREEAYRASDFIKRSLRGSMMENDRPHIYESIEILGSEPGMEVIRIYSDVGEIRYSSHEGEVGTRVDLQAEACYACHAYGEPLHSLPTAEKTRIYQKDHSYRVLGVINPIYNARSCYTAACHAHSPDQQILGVLDVQISMQEMDAALAGATKRAYAAALAFILLSALLVAAIVYRAIYLPTARLRRGTEALAGGDLDVEIQLDRTDELGALATSFNAMARNLNKAYGELKSWSERLEERVQEKTEELEEVHQQMIQVEKAASLGKMAATVAHELNNPLSGILTYAKLLARKLEKRLPVGPDRDTILSELELIRTESRRCGRIVRDLLTYARESPHEFQNEHLHSLVDRALKLAAHHLELGEIESHRAFGLEDDSIVCDGEQIVQAMLALIINAVEAMPDGGALTIGTAEIEGSDPPSVRLLVSDSGCGIPDDIKDRIFDPFFSTKSEAKGVGLGLAVVYGIVRRHEGRIAVESRVGQGTTFSVELLREPRAAATSHTPEILSSGWVS